jgi:hypothetical protein
MGGDGRMDGWGCMHDRMDEWMDNGEEEGAQRGGYLRLVRGVPKVCCGGS